MNQTTEAYVVADPTSSFKLTKVTVKPLSANDVRLQMICSGLCHTDVHMQKNDWGITEYPVLPGHEGIGRVIELGSAVKSLKMNDKVGVGWISGSCEGCPPCVRGEENICADGHTGTYTAGNAMGGTFAKEMVLSSRFCYKVPEVIPSIIAAPLLCAGITVYSPLRKWVKANDKVGIISVGGLGHLAIQFARALGAEVTVFSTSKRKEADAKKFGASKFVVFTDEQEFKATANTMDVILNTCPYTIPLDGFLDSLVAGGVFCYLGLPESGEAELKVNLYKIVFGQKTLAGSIVGGSRYMIEMFQLVEKFGVVSSVKAVEFSTINETCDKLMKGQLDGAYRFTLCWEDCRKLEKEVEEFTRDNLSR
eukprot:GHVH01005253.1.p1 GENE.GHVH01005253.1~~GHVH01005253.1.p1  ORF type:complete len:365 (+),score=54.39 GHVH01005253.1:253-1347(+)